MKVITLKEAIKIIDEKKKDKIFNSILTLLMKFAKENNLEIARYNNMDEYPNYPFSKKPSGILKIDASYEERKTPLIEYYKKAFEQR